MYITSESRIQTQKEFTRKEKANILNEVNKDGKRDGGSLCFKTSVN